MEVYVNMKCNAMQLDTAECKINLVSIILR
jgi:hypothetical protein